jgi:hypothetical protein
MSGIVDHYNRPDEIGLSRDPQGSAPQCIATDQKTFPC